MFNGIKSYVKKISREIVCEGVELYYCLHNDTNRTNLTLIKTPNDLGFFSHNFGPPIKNSQLIDCKILANRSLALEYMPKNVVCAEIGTCHGDFAQQIMDNMNPKELHLIDTYYFQPGDPEPWGFTRFRDSGLNQEQYIRTRFKEYENVFLKKGFSYDVLYDYPDDYFDYVYLDAAHDYDSVKKDITALKRKVKCGGIIAFNDYTFFSLDEDFEYGVLRAVNEYLAESDHKVLFYCLNFDKMDDIIVQINKRGLRNE